MSNGIGALDIFEMAEAARRARTGGGREAATRRPGRRDGAIDEVIRISRTGRRTVRPRGDLRPGPRRAELIRTREARREEFYRLLAAEGLNASWARAIEFERRLRAEDVVRRKVGAARRRPPARQGEPGFDGGRRLVAEHVENPYRPGTYEKATRNARHDPIEQLYAQRDRRGRPIISGLERDAATKVREIVETLGLDAVKAIVMEPKVAASSKWRDLPAHLIDAGRRMAALRRALGPDMTAVLVRVAGYGETVTLVAIDYEESEEAKANGGCGKGTREGVGWLLRLALRRAVDHFFGGTATGAPSRGVTAWLAEDAIPRETVEIAAQRLLNAALAHSGH